MALTSVLQYFMNCNEFFFFVAACSKPWTSRYITNNNPGKNKDQKKRFHYLKTGSRKSLKAVCVVCGKNFGSLKKLKHKKTAHSGCFTNRMSRSKSASQSGFFKKINLHPKPKTCIEKSASRSVSIIVKCHNQVWIAFLNFEQSDDDCGLVCRVCGKGLRQTPKDLRGR